MKIEEKIQHIEFIQNTITRMNNNSFQIKKWMLTITAGFIGFYASSKNTLFLIAPICIVIVFAMLDTYYLQLERKFRGLYNDVCNIEKSKLEKDISVYDMDISSYRGGFYSFWSTLISPSVLPLYLCVIISLLLIKYLG